jgi:hypothetical protein
MDVSISAVAGASEAGAWNCHRNLKTLHQNCDSPGKDLLRRRVFRDMSGARHRDRTATNRPQFGGFPA